MPTRTEIIAQIDSVLSRLERARDFLAASLADSSTDAIKVSSRKPKVKIAAKALKQPVVAAAAVAADQPRTVVAAPPPPPAKEEPQVHRVPPKRRFERRQADKVSKSAAALSGPVPTGPVAVSAVEARKQQERTVQPIAPLPIESAPLGSERSLGSLIQAFERRAGLSGIETP